MKLSLLTVLVFATHASTSAIEPAHMNLEEQSPAASRLLQENGHLDLADPRELAMKVRSLLRDEYTYFRGCASAFYRCAHPMVRDWLEDKASWVILHGDIHIGNVGTYQGPGEAGADIRFGVVDFDEAMEGPFQLDLLRALLALRFAAGAEGRTFVDEAAAKALCDGYRGVVSGELSYSGLAGRYAVVAQLMRKAARTDAKKYAARYAESNGRLGFRSKRIKDGQIKDILEAPGEGETSEIIDAVWRYLDRGCDADVRNRFRFANPEELRQGVLDVARWTRLESSGSQGVHKYLVLLDRPLQGEDTPLILELKEQPLPAAARVGFLAAETGTGRARQVATAYGQLLDPTPRLVGFTQMGERGYLVRTKDPWGEELDPSDFDLRHREGVIQAAGLLGEVLGLAHRNSLLRGNLPDRVSLIVDRLETLPKRLQEMSKVLEVQLRDEFESFGKDPTMRQLAHRADQYIKRFE